MADRRAELRRLAREERERVQRAAVEEAGRRLAASFGPEEMRALAESGARLRADADVQAWVDRQPAPALSEAQVVRLGQILLPHLTGERSAGEADA